MSSRMFHDVLCKAQMLGHLVEVYTDAEAMGQFTVGYVLAVDESDFTLRCITPEGEEDGTTFEDIDDVLKIAEDSIYLRKLRVLIEERGNVYEKNFDEVYDEKDEHTNYSELVRAKEREQIVTLYLRDDQSDDAAMGFVEELSETFVQVREVSCQGERNGLTTIRIEDIGRISRNARDARRYALYYKHNERLGFDAEFEASRKGNLPNSEHNKS